MASSENPEIVALKNKNRDSKAYLGFTFIPVFIGSVILDILITGGNSEVSGLTFLFTGVGMAFYYSRLNKKNQVRNEQIAKLESN